MMSNTPKIAYRIERRAKGSRRWHTIRRNIPTEEGSRVLFRQLLAEPSAKHYEYRTVTEEP
jgi:hypothetical protein